MDYLTLSNEHTFLITAFDGDVPAVDGRLGLYYRDTRHLGELELRLNGEPLQLLSSGDEDVYRTTAVLSNGYLRTADGQQVWPGTIGATRSRVVSHAVSEQLRLTNYGSSPLRLELSIQLGADFADLFEVRGFEFSRTGQMLAPQQEPDGVLLRYQGGDGVRRSTRVSWDHAPDELTYPEPEAPQTETPEAGAPPPPTRARLLWRLAIPPRGEWSLELSYAPLQEGPEGEARQPVRTHDGDMQQLASSYGDWGADSTRIQTDNEEFSRLLERSALDLRALTVTYSTGRLPVAGIPWYAVPFGRDSLITALQALCLQPELAAGTLRFLAAHQGERDDAWRDEEPGKIMHELRFGEMAGLRAVPHTPYYGTVDATPLFVMLFAQTVRWTGNRQLYEELIPSVRRALEWVDRWGDLDGDGYVEYRARSERGIRNQGWKDSGDSLLYPDGTLVEPPVALVEVQAYVHAAKSWLAPLAARMGDDELAARLEQEAAALRERFNRDFWVEGEGCYAQALDADKRAIQDVTSNAGHALIGGIAPAERAVQVARRLLAPDMASGWGVRTRSSSDPNYNPISYHNGSVWPHDNSLIVLGLAQSGLREEANQVAGQVFSAGRQFRLSRLPELYCGFAPGETGLGRPADYPVSCSPQAWAAGSPYLFMQSILGLEPNALENTLRLRPHMPEWLGCVEVRNLRVGEGRVHLRVSAGGTEVVSSGGVDVRASG